MKNTQTAEQFPRQFYLANAMEIFERIAWYGFFTVSSLYMASSPATGGLGFSDSERGVLQGIVPFFVYVLPVFTGALGDRLGYKRMFLVAFLTLVPAYYLLGQVQGFWSFLAVYLTVALGAAVFKPLVVATVARSSSASNRGLAFGIFYLMVNVGGFIGPIIAGYVRAISWDMVFILASSAIAVNLLILPLLPKDKSTASAAEGAEAFKDVQKVLGNGRFALLVGLLLIALLVAGGGWISWGLFGSFTALWLMIHFVWDRAVADKPDGSWLQAKMRIGDGPFLTYLLVLSLFWAAYNQIFVTLPLYLRDFVDTNDLVGLLGFMGDGFIDFISPVNTEALAKAISGLAESGSTNAETLQAALLTVSELQVKPTIEALQEGLALVAATPSAAQSVAQDWASAYRQVSPEYIIAIDFLMIVLFQYLVSRFAQNRNPFGILVTGSLLIGGAYIIGGLAHMVPFAGLTTVFAVAVFAVGEMLASPKSQEFVAAIAPKEKAAMFMGYYFISLALGFLFAGLLSGWAYGLFADTLKQPLLMWGLFAAIAFASAAGLVLFNRYGAPKMRQA